MFVKPVAFRSDKGDILLTEVKYKEIENQKENADIFIGQAAKKFLCDDKEQLNVDNFYNSVRNYYIIKKYPYVNELLINVSVTDIDKRPGASFSSLTFFTERFPRLLPVDADIVIGALHGEFLRYQVDQFLKELTSQIIDAAWHLISQMQMLSRLFPC